MPMAVQGWNDWGVALALFDLEALAPPMKAMGVATAAGGEPAVTRFGVALMVARFAVGLVGLFVLVVLLKSGSSHSTCEVLERRVVAAQESQVSGLTAADRERRQRRLERLRDQQARASCRR